MRSFFPSGEGVLVIGSFTRGVGRDACLSRPDGIAGNFGIRMLEQVKMDIFLSKERVDTQDCDVLVTGFFRDERPLKGSTGRIDWRFNGMLSQFLVDGKLTGDWMETTLIPSQERILPRMILLIGLGEVKEYDHLRLRKLLPDLSDTLHKLGPGSVCLSFPYGEGYHVDCRKTVESLILGIGDSLQGQSSSVQKWTRTLRLCFAEGEEYFQEIQLGVQAAKSMLGERIQIKISTPSEDPYPQNTRLRP